MRKESKKGGVLQFRSVLDRSSSRLAKYSNNEWWKVHNGKFFFEYSIQQILHLLFYRRYVIKIQYRLDSVLSLSLLPTSSIGSIKQQSMNNLLVLVLILLSGFSWPHTTNAQDPVYTVFYHPSNNTYSIRPGRSEDGVAYAFWIDEIQSTGWSKLYISSNANYSDDQQMYAAGYLVRINTV